MHLDAWTSAVALRGRRRMTGAGSAALRPADAALVRRIEALSPWFQNMNLGGHWTAPDHFLGNYPADKFRHFADALPADLTGMSVLDIGCNAGFYAIEMKRRGAARVVGVDEDERYLGQARLACEVTGAEVELRRLSVYDVALLDERFDVVLFMGVLYHLRHPLLALDLIHEHVAGDMLVFQSLQRGSADAAELRDDYEFEETDPFHHPSFPRLHFIERQYAHDWTNWWIPNRACSEAMLRAAGFRIEKRAHEDVYICRRGKRADAEWQQAAAYPARAEPRGEG
jgi:tRNA (mo5U34)-methyltransferase